jgi:hypothetical protein
MQPKTGQQIDQRKGKAEMRFLCSVVGYTLLDQERSTDIHSKLKILNLTERIEKQKENWH